MMAAMPAVQEVPTVDVLFDVAAERARQEEGWGVQRHWDGIGPLRQLALDGRAPTYANLAILMKDRYSALRSHRRGPDWATILLEEVFEAVELPGDAASADMLREELVQVAAVAVAWIEDLDSRKPYQPTPPGVL